jgi:hypothetical protein
MLELHFADIRTASYARSTRGARGRHLVFADWTLVFIYSILRLAFDTEGFTVQHYSTTAM